MKVYPSTVLKCIVQYANEHEGQVPSWRVLAKLYTRRRRLTRLTPYQSIAKVVQEKLIPQGLLKAVENPQFNQPTYRLPKQGE